MAVGKTYINPKTVDEAIVAAHENENSRYLAGGTDLLVNKFQGNDRADCLIDLTGIDELKNVSVENDFLKIGSLVRLNDLKSHSEIRNKFPVLIESVESVAAPVIRKTASIGGNILCENRCIFYNQSEWWREAAGYCLKCDGDICIATGGKTNCYSKFVSDVAVALISMDAKIEIAEKNGTKISALEEIYTGDGVEPRNLKKSAIIKSILIPFNHNFRASFRKLRQRDSIDFTSLTTCVSIFHKEKIKIVVGGVDPKPVIVEGKIYGDKNELIKRAVKKSRVVDNDVFSRKHRREMLKVFLKKSFSELNF